MIKLVQGFDICSPLPIDGRILLSKSEMYNIDDNILPERYFAFCKDDGRLYLYYKSNVRTAETGKFVLADTTVDERIDEEVETLNTRIDNEVETLNERVDDEVATLNDRVDTEVATLNTRIDGEVATLNTKIDDYKVEADEKFIDGDELTEALEPYSLIDATGNKLRINFDDQDYRLSVTLLDANDNELSTTEEIDIPLESVVIDGRYDADTKELILTLVNGHEIKFSIADLIEGLVNEVDFNAHVENNDRHINAGEREMWNLSETALQPEVLNDYYTKDEIDTKIVAGDNVTVDLNSQGTITISAIDTTYTAGPGVTINDDNQISTNSAAPEWSAIEGDNPLDNTALDAIVSPLITHVDSLNEDVYGEGSLGENGLIYNVDNLMTTVDNHVSNTDIHVTAEQKEAWTLKYDKPAEGIPNADLSSYVRNRITQVDRNKNSITEINAEIETIKQQMADESKLEEEITRATEAEAALDTKIDVETSARETAISGVEAALNTEAQTRATADATIDGKLVDIEAEIQVINSKIPNTATAANQLADKEFVNSSIATSTAEFRGTVETTAALKALTGNLNDYAFLKVMDSTTGLVKQYDRYKYSETVSAETGNWAYEFTLNNSSFTAEQWAAINSNATAELIAKITTNETAITNLNTSKVNVETGKSLVLDTEITRLASMATNANAVAESSTNGNIRVTTRSGGSETTTDVNVYTLPQKFDDTVQSANKVKVNNIQAPVSSGSSTYGVGDNGQVLTSNGSNVYWADGKEYSAKAGGGIEQESTSTGIMFKQTYMDNISISVSDWQAVGGVYMATVSGLEGITADSHPILDVFISPSVTDIDSVLEAWSLIYSAVTSEESITFYAKEAPQVQLSVQAKG